MTGQELKEYRKNSRLSQEESAKLLGVSQTYLSLLETNKRRVTERLKEKLVQKMHVRPTELPALANKYKVSTVSDDQLTADLAALGYKGFSHYKPSRLKNPADVLLSALKADDRDARLMEALPWLVLAFPEMNWKYLSRVAKMYDLQNRLGFVVSVARGIAEQKQDKTTAAGLRSREADLEPSILEREDTLCHDSMTNAERRWLLTNRTDEAKHWRILASLSPQLVRYAD